jgi:hypothetical protein
MGNSQDNELRRLQYGYWTLWCRKFGYRSYRNVYAVFMARDGEAFHQEVHRVHGALGNGEHFAGFLVRSQVRKHAYAALSDAFCSGLKSKERRGGNWVVVEADSPESALAHDDVAEVKDEMMKTGPTHSFCGVYFISNSRGAIKIGSTASSVTQRLSTLQAGSAYPLTLVAVIHTTSHKKVEAELHEKWKRRRLQSEWFELTDEEAVQIAKDHGGMAMIRRLNRSSLMPKCRA